MIKKIFILLIILLLAIFGGWGIYNYNLFHSEIEKLNICQNDELIVQLIEKNINPFSRFKFLKQRSADCKELLIENKKAALTTQKEEYCSVLDDSKISSIMLIYLYVNELYDRRAASDELNSLVPLMTPYNYCSQYIDNIIDLVKIKKRLAL